MTKMRWGLLGPGSVMSERRVRSLGLAGAVRRFNERAVPGIGGVWFGRELVLAALGIRLAGQASRVTNVEAATAIEALGCWFGLRAKLWGPDPHLRGRTRLSRDPDAQTFKRLRHRSAYVSQTMRMATVAALKPLGLATSEGTRFNSFRLTERGEAFVISAYGGLVAFSQMERRLLRWMHGGVSGAKLETVQALSPIDPLPPEALGLLDDFLQRGVDDPAQESVEDRSRRAAALRWVRSLRSAEVAGSWDLRPQTVSEAHWLDLRAGAALFGARESALALLDAIERQVALASGERWPLPTRLPEPLREPFDRLQARARDFLALDRSDSEARAFCFECSEESQQAVLANLLRRDGRVLRLDSGEARRGVASRSLQTGEASNPDAASATGSDVRKMPEGISYRMENLQLLSEEIDGISNKATVTASE